MRQNHRRGNFRGNVGSYGRHKIVEESTEIVIEMTVMTEAGTGLEKGYFPEIMAIVELEVQATVDPGQDPELAQIGTKFVVINVGNMIILQGTVPLLRNKCSIWEMSKQ